MSEKKSPNTYLIGVNYYTAHIKDKSKKAQRQALYWMFNVGTPYALKTAVKAFVDADMIRRCVEGRTELDVEWLKKSKVRGER